MAFSLPPWLLSTPADFLRASEAGANLGLQAGTELSQQRNAAARQALAANELGQRQTDSANRLGLAYATMQNRNQMAASKQAALDLYRQQRLDEAQQRIGLGEAGLAQRAQSQDAALALREAMAQRFQGVNLGRGGFGRFDPTSGAFNLIRQPEAATAAKALTDEQFAKREDVRTQLSLLNKAILSQQAVVAKDPENADAKSYLKDLQRQHDALLSGGGADVTAPLLDVPPAEGAAGELGDVTSPLWQKAYDLSAGREKPETDPLGLFSK